MSLIDRVRQDLGNDFEVEREIGRGGMGAVFLARDRALDCAVAVKVLLPEQASARALARFRRESRFLARFDHPHIVRALRAGTTPGGLDYLVMPYLPGDTLRSRLDVQNRLPTRTAVRFGMELLSALGAIHARGLVHRDVKPANLVLVDDHVRLTDFGIAHDDGSDTETLTQADRPPGTAAYMAPEQSAGTVDPRSDVYAAALVCYEMLTGRRWTSDAGWDQVPRPVAAVVRRGLAADPERRWPTAVAFRRALARAGQPWRDLRWVAAAGAVGVIAVLSVMRGSPLPPPPLAVMPFRAPAGQEALGEAIGWLTNQQLEQHIARGGPALADWGVGVELVAKHPLIGDSLSVAIREALPTRHVLYGAVETAGDSVIVRASIADRAGERRRIGRFAASWEHRYDLACQVGFAAVSYLSEATMGEWRCALPDRDAGAIEALAAGEWAFQREMWALADQEYQRALQSDSTLALAWWRLYITRQWRRRAYGASLAEVMRRWGSQLGQMDSLLVESELAPPGRERLARLEEAVRRFPDHGQPRLLLGNELFHRGPLIGIGLDSAIVVLEGAIAVGAGRATALSTGAWAAIRWGDSARAQEWLAQYRAVASETTDDGFCLVCLLEVAWGARFTPGAAAPTRALLARPEGVVVLVSGLRWGLGIGIPEAQEQLAAVLASHPALSPTERAEAAIGRAVALMALGQPRRAVAVLSEAAVAAPSPLARELVVEAAEWPVILASLGFPGFDEGDVRAGRAVLTQFADDPAHGARVRWALALTAPTGPPVLAPDTALISPFARAAGYIGWAGQAPSANAASWWRWYENADLTGWPVGGLHAVEVDWALETYARVRGGLAALSSGQTALGCDLLREVPARWASAESALAAWRAEAVRALGSCHD